MTTDINNEYGDDSLVHQYLERTDLNKSYGHWNKSSYKMGDRIVTYYILCVYDTNGNWTNDKLTFRLKRQMESFGKKLKIKLIESKSITPALKGGA